jgi:anti-sigma regulatory factor (Ser/Thr protein kinase)
VIAPSTRVDPHAVAAMDLPFAPDVTAPGAARSELRALPLTAGERDIVALLVSELVTNCVRYAALGTRQRIRMWAHVTDEAIRVEVIDGGAGIGVALRRAAPPNGGWGLQLVDQLADRWGITHAAGTHVWFELDRDDVDGERPRL